MTDSPFLNHYRETGRLTKASILLALQELSDRLSQAGEQGKILLLGGAAMILAYQNREGTKDIDAILEPKTLLHQISFQMALDHGLPEGWLNDGAKGFMPDPSRCTFSQEGIPQFSNLLVFVPTPDMLFAMKALATRIENAPDGKMSRDLEDLKTLAKVLKVRSREEAERIVSAFYPPERIPLRFWYALDEILD